MKNLKKLLAIVVCIAMMVPTVAFAATSSPAKVDVKSATAKSLTYNAKSQTTTIVVNGKTLTLNKDFKVVSGSLKATKAGTYTVKIKGIGNYSGDTTVKYTVNAQQSYKATAAARHTMLRIRQPRLQLSMVTQFSREVLITRLLV